MSDDAFLFYLRTFAPDLPEPVCEHRFHHTRRWRFDFCWPLNHHKIAVEINGGQWVNGRHNRAGQGYENDLEKLSYAAAYGWCVLQFTPQQLNNDPAGCIALVQLAFENKE
jgi:very-short-patch-repair endonuclease